MASAGETMVFSPAFCQLPRSAAAAPPTAKPAMALPR